MSDLNENDMNNTGTQPDMNADSSQNVNSGTQDGYNQNAVSGTQDGYNQNAGSGTQSSYDQSAGSGAQNNYNQNTGSQAQGGYQFSQPAGNVNYTDKNSGSQRVYTNPDPLAGAGNNGGSGRNTYNGQAQNGAYNGSAGNGQNNYGGQTQSSQNAYNGSAGNGQNNYGGQAQSSQNGYNGSVGNGQNSYGGQTSQSAYDGRTQNSYNGQGQPNQNNYGGQVPPVNPPKPKKDYTGLKNFGKFVGKVAAGALVASVVFSLVFGAFQRTGLIETAEPAESSRNTQNEPDWSENPFFGGGQNGNDNNDGNGSDNGNDNNDNDGNANQQSASGPKLGVRVETVTEAMQNEGTPAGARIISVEEGSAADEAGLKEGDVITAFDGNMVRSSSELASMIKSSDTGKEYKLNYKRVDGSDYKTYSTTVTFSDDTASDQTAQAEG